MADEADAFAGADGEVDAVERADGAEMLFDAVQLDDVGPVSASRSADLRRQAARSLHVGFDRLLIASSWVYSWLATPPSSIVGRAASKSSWVKAR